ncbi:MAG: M48 family metalloprotease [Planctomycetia bacterium]|nr:M48 family metalloprotease [Planctomycetia bacterium]
MSAWETVSQRWLDWMVAASWQLAVLVCVVAVATRALRAASPRLRHALWLLVLVKVFFPPGLTTPWSIGHWVIAPALATTDFARPSSPPTGGPAGSTVAGNAERPAAEHTATPTEPGLSPAARASIVWAAGCLSVWATVGWRYVWLTRAIRSDPTIDDGPVRVALEQLALELGVRHMPRLVTTNLVTSPFLFGVWRPRIVLPEPLLRQLSEVDLRAVLAHELVHWKRHDTWIGWLQVVAQGIFWFHPFVWCANRQIRHERETVCDEMVLHLGNISPRHYGDAIIRVLCAAQGRSLVGASQVGVFERGSNLQNRLEDIMSYEPIKRRFNWRSRLALLAFAAMFLPMAAGVTGSGKADDKPNDGTPDDPQSRLPQIVKTIPKPGETGVDPGLKEIVVVFDRDMDGGVSWTGGPPLFPPIDSSRKIGWRDARTCVLPVTLEEGTFYRLGINSTSYQNFRSTAGVAARPSSVYFATRGATAEVAGRVRAPEIVALDPKNGARDVDPKIAALRVTFNMPMGEGMSWVVSGPGYPNSPAGKKAEWSPDGLSCTLPVALEAGHDYELGLNNASHINFQSKWGVPLKPVEYRFRTRDGK